MPACSICSRLWPCSVPGRKTLTAKALLSTDELSEHTPSPSCVILASLHLPLSLHTHARSLQSTLQLYPRYKSEATGKCGVNAQKEGAEAARLWWQNPCMQLYLFPSESPNELEVLTKSPFVLIESEGHSSTILIINAVSPLLSENHSALQTTQLSGACFSYGYAQSSWGFCTFL